MFIKNLSLSEFRNFRSKKIEFSDGVTVIVGDNATGKTNILEAIGLLATGKSFKARLESEMIRYDSDIARVSAVLSIMNNVLNKDDENNSKIRNTKYIIQETSLEAVLTDGEVQIGEDSKNIKKAQRKKLLVNGVAKRLIDFAGNLKIVLFGPWDLDLVTESPSLRRRFLDSVLSQTDREYRRSVMIYEKGLRQRNRLLMRIRDENVSRGQLMYWDRLLIKHGQYLTEKREKLINYINNYQFPISTHLRQGFGGQANKYQLEYDRSAISEGRLAQYEEEEISAATTLVGPHRDDMLFKLKTQKSKVKSEERDLARFGSRGEARMGILWLKLAELSYLENITNDPSTGSGQGKPVLLLDDIFSELDHEHRDIVMGIVNKQQTLITTADVHNIEGIKGAEIVHLD